MVDDAFDVFLGSLYYYLSEYFCINVREGNWSTTLFFVVVVESLCGLAIRLTVASQKDFGDVLYVSILSNTLRDICISSSLKVLQNFALKPSAP